MNRHTRRFILSMAAVALAGLALAAPRPVTAQCAFTIIDVPGAASTDLTAALNQLSAFQNKARAQIARSNPALANELTSAARQIVGVVGGM